VDALELAIDGSETHVGHFVHLAELVQTSSQFFAALTSRSVCAAESRHFDLIDHHCKPGRAPSRFFTGPNQAH